MDEATSQALHVLTSQYQQAVELYMHEDLLNWNKLYNLSYVTVGLLAALGYFLSNRPRGRAMPWAICALGLVISSGFIFANWVGVDYLYTRKRAAVRIERALKVREPGAQHVVASQDAFTFPAPEKATNPVLEEEKSIAEKMDYSPTRWVIRGAPILGTGFWCLLALCIGFWPDWFGIDRSSALPSPR